MNILPNLKIYFTTKSSYFIWNVFCVIDNMAYHTNTICKEINDIKLYSKQLVVNIVRIHKKKIESSDIIL